MSSPVSLSNDIHAGRGGVTENNANSPPVSFGSTPKGLSAGLMTKSDRGRCGEVLFVKHVALTSILAFVQRRS